MDSWYEAELLTDDGVHSLVIASHWNETPQPPRVKRGAQAPQPPPSVAWARGWLFGVSGLRERIIDLGILTERPAGKVDLPHWTPDDFASLLSAMLLEPEELARHLADDPSPDTAADFARGISDAKLRPATIHHVEPQQSDVRTLVQAAVWGPYVPHEQSPPSFDSLVNLAGLGGGLGLGVLVAAGALAPIALVTVPGGLVAYGLGQGLKRRVRRLVDPQRRAFEEIRDLERAGVLTKEQADRLIDDEIASRKE